MRASQTNPTLAMLRKIYNHLVAPKLQLATASAYARKLGLTTFQVVGANMAPTLSPGEVGLFKSLEDSSTLGPGHVIAYVTEEHGATVIPSRVVGLAGEVVEICNGDLLVNSVQVPEPYLQPGRAEREYSSNVQPVSVPEGFVFILGDFRDMSKDSRNFGPLPLRCVLGRVLHAHPLGEHAAPRSIR